MLNILRETISQISTQTLFELIQFVEAIIFGFNFSTIIQIFTFQEKLKVMFNFFFLLNI